MQCEVLNCITFARSVCACVRVCLRACRLHMRKLFHHSSTNKSDTLHTIVHFFLFYADPSAHTALFMQIQCRVQSVHCGASPVMNSFPLK
jgi:hypothetical protein